jgi:hypothetical protein
MRVIVGLAFVLAWCLPASAAQKNCDNLRGEKKVACLSDNIKDLNAQLTGGFLLANSGQTANNQCIALQVDTSTSPIMVPCGASFPIPLRTWTLKPK